MGAEIWDFIRQSEYLKQQVHDGVYAWYVRNAERPFDLLLRDLNIDEALIQHELQCTATTCYTANDRFRLVTGTFTPLFRAVLLSELKL